MGLRVALDLPPLLPQSGDPPSSGPTVVASGFSVEDPKAVELPKVRDFKKIFGVSDKLCGLSIGSGFAA